jgi:octaprenyl-diphosphate synthase
MALAMHEMSALIAPDMAEVDRIFAAELHSELPQVNQLCTHVARFRGKMLRPMLVLLTGRAALDTPPARMSDAHVTLATVVEMVHMATLVHDDILDGAEVRRRGATINYLHGNEAAVLLGDYLISHAYHLCASLNNQDFARLVAHATNVVCEGELTQNFNRRNWKLTEAAYFDIIYRKTAVLTETCCRLGAMASTRRTERVEALATFGRKIGLAFQIVDDILDICGTTRTVGKSLGTDIEKGKLTLPMIHFLKHAAAQHRALLVDLLDSKDADRVSRVRQLLAPSPSMAAARQAAEKLVSEAITALHHGVAPGDARDVLEEMARFVTAREL